MPVVYVLTLYFKTAGKDQKHSSTRRDFIEGLTKAHMDDADAKGYALYWS